VVAQTRQPLNNAGMRSRALPVLILALVACQEKAPPPREPSTPPEKKSRPRAFEARWPRACQKIRARLDPAVAGQRARPLPPRAIPPDPWTLVLGSFGVTLSKDRYVLKVRRSGKGLTALLETPTRKVLVIRDAAEAPLTDVFAMAGEVVPSAARQARTRELFGAAPTSFELVRMGYGHGLDDLRCEVERAATEIPIAVGLVLKGTGHWAEEVYTLDPVPGLLLLGKRGDRCMVEIQVQDRSASTIVTHVSNDRQPCMERAARVQIRAGLEPAGPPWLLALGQALLQPTKAHWQSLRAEMVRARAPRDSVASVDAMLNP